MSLRLSLLLLLLVACKPVQDEDSSMLAVEAGTKSVDTDTVEQFNLAEYVSKNKIGGANFANNVKTGNAYLFFNSNEEQKPNKENSAEAAKSKNKSMLSKPEYELRINATITSNSKTAEIKSLFWMDGSLNGTKVYPSGNAVEASIVGNAKSNITVKAGLKAFGKDLISKNLLATAPMKITKTVDLEYKQTVLGIPKIAGVEAGVSFVAAANVSGETDYLSKESVTVSMVPDVKVTAGISGTVKALLFTEAKAAGTVTVLDSSFPSSATLGGRVGSGADFLYGNVTFDAGTFNALKGELVISAKASTGNVLPKGVEAALWSAAEIVNPSLAKKVQAGFKWAYVVWDSPPLVSIKFPAYYTHSFLLSNAKKASCAKPVLTKVVAEVTKENGKDTGEMKTVGKSALEGLKALQTKANALKGACSAK